MLVVTSECSVKMEDSNHMIDILEANILFMVNVELYVTSVINRHCLTYIYTVVFPV